MFHPILPRVHRFVSFLGLALALALRARGANLPPVTVFTDPPAFRMVKLSPDGKFLAAVSVRNFTESVGLIDLATMQATPAATFTNVTVRNFWWKGSDRILFLVGNNLGERRFRLLDLKTQKLLSQWTMDQRFSIVNPLIADPDHMLIEDDMTRLKKLNILTGKAEIFESKGKDVTNWLTDRSGHAVAALGREDENWFMLKRPAADAEWQRVSLGSRSWPDFWPMAVYTDQRRLIGQDRVTANTARVVVRDPVTGSDELLFFSEEVDPSYNLVWGDDHTHIRAIVYETDRPYALYLDKPDAVLAKSIDLALPGTTNIITSTSADEKQLIVESTSDTVPETYYLLNRPAGKMSLLGSARPDIDPRQSISAHYFHFTARDGLPLTGRIYLPATNGTPPPLLVSAVGDLSDRNYSGFQPYLQLLASRGYAILEVNHRGVDGFGQKHATAGIGQVDGKMCDDLADGVRHAIESGWVDGHHVAILGQHQGGLLGLFTLARHPELFCAWINLGTPMTTADLEPEDFAFGIHEKRGNSLPKAQASKLREYIRKLDPLGHLAQVKVPSFHYYARDSYGAALTEGDKAHRYLVKAGLPVTFLVAPSRLDWTNTVESYRQHQTEETTRMYNELLKFLSVYLPTSAPTATASASAK